MYKSMKFGLVGIKRGKRFYFFFLLFCLFGFFFFFSWFRCVIVKYNKEGSKITKGQ